jgi:hypothetical protein
MTDAEIYKKWPYRTRYLRPECWSVINRILHNHRITSILEFGSGISTALFNNHGIDVVSYDTDPAYLKFIKSLNLANVEFRLWNNKKTSIEGEFGLSLVDGALPRTRQLYYAMKHSRYIAIDDFTDPESNKGLKEMLSGFELIAGRGCKLRVFRRIK